MRVETDRPGIRLAYCVYEHWRPDTHACFYVGKGKPRRSKSFEARNDRYRKIVAKLKRLGLKPEIRIVASGLSEADAIALEVGTIRERRTAGVDLANYTDGGDGTSGRVHSAETKAKIAAKAVGRAVSKESKAKMIASRTGLKRSDATKAKQSAAAKIVQKVRRVRECADPAEAARMAEMARRIAADPDMRARRSINAKALWADPEYRERVLAARQR